VSPEAAVVYDARAVPQLLLVDRHGRVQWSTWVRSPPGGLLRPGAGSGAGEPGRATAPGLIVPWAACSLRDLKFRFRAGTKYGW
jgi:hypothetical protein